MKGSLPDKIQRFTDAYNCNYSSLFNSIYSRVADVDACEDICQEVFMRFFSKIDSVENPRAWLFGTMRLVIFDYYKAKGKAPSEIDAIVEESSMSYVNGFREARIIIEEALNSPGVFSDEKERVVFDLIAVSNYTYAEAAEHTGMTYRQARYSFEKTTHRLVDYLKIKGISGLEDLL